MANQELLYILRQGVAAWNQWRELHPETRLGVIELDHPEAGLLIADLSKPVLREAYPREAGFRPADLRGARLSEADLAGADLSGVDLREAQLIGAHLDGANLREAYLGGADFHGANLSGANLSGADLHVMDPFEGISCGANFSKACLRGADLREAHLTGVCFSGADLSRTNFSGIDLRKVNLQAANLSEADLSEADLSGQSLRGMRLSNAKLTRTRLKGVDFSGADLREADLQGANLETALFVETNLTKAELTGCRVYGISAWAVQLEGARQENLVITSENEPMITVDSLEVAQFIYLLLNNQKIRGVIDTITSKMVLILGRFIPERKVILDALKETLRQHNYLPVVFDFEKPASRDLTETISTLAHLARFVIADITDPRSVPQELQAIVPVLEVPVQPIIARPQQPWGMFIDFPKKYRWVLEVHEYTDLNDLLADLQTRVIGPAEAKAKQLAAR